MWTADGQYIVFTSTEGFSNGIATQGGITATTELWVLALRDRDRDPGNRDIDNEAQGLAAQAEARRTCAGGVPEVRIDWSGLPRRAKQLTVHRQCHRIADASARGSFVALTIGTRAAGGGGGAGRRRRRHLHHQRRKRPLTRVPRAPQDAEGGGGGNPGGGGGLGGGPGFVFARDGRTLYFRSAPDCMQPRSTSTPSARAAPAARAAEPRRRKQRGTAGANATARRVTYTAKLEVDRKALRAQVFNEGWRIMKNRFYDSKMHGVTWREMKSSTSRCSTTSSTTTSCRPS